MGKLKNHLQDLIYSEELQLTTEGSKTSYRSFSSTKEYLGSLVSRKRLIERFSKFKKEKHEAKALRDSSYSL